MIASNPRLRLAPAPLLCNKQGSNHTVCGIVPTVHAALHVAYVLWGEHHAACPVCGGEDWYMPGGIRFVDDEVLAEGRVMVKGEVFLYRRSPDPSVLCPEGAKLFRQWVSECLRRPVSV